MIIYCEGWLHHKNKIGMSLLEEEGVHLLEDTSPDITPDIVCMFDKIIDIRVITHLESYDGPVIFGPHFFVFCEGYTYQQDPDSFVDDRLFSGDKPYYYNLLSEWNSLLAQDICGFPAQSAISLPFPVEVNRFCPEEKTGRPVVYFKNRDPEILKDVLGYLGDPFDKGQFSFFSVGKGYKEEDFLEAVSKAPYCIWIGCHESQGFALQETLSCDTPIFVINIRSLREEFESMWSPSECVPGHSLLATSAPYFDESCGLITYPETYKDDFSVFLDNLSNYSPRDFILKNLSPKACKALWERYV